VTITTNPEIFAGICALRVTVTGSGFGPNTFVVGEFIRSDGTIVDEPHFDEATDAMGNLNSYFFFYEAVTTPAGTYTMRFFEDIIRNHEFDSNVETIAVIPTTTLTVPPPIYHH
jgi:hypothetical protein